jgi:hypothetical protein
MKCDEGGTIRYKSDKFLNVKSGVGVGSLILLFAMYRWLYSKESMDKIEVWPKVAGKRNKGRS